MLEEESEYQEIRRVKYPDVNIQLNNISVVALLDTGSQINALTTERYHKNKKTNGQHTRIESNERGCKRSSREKVQANNTTSDARGKDR